ncbi:uncharacterized protein LOC133191465 [Saccostrea echinata]|uniref:uncharacterized protein LOC133191465 n=1 Tax=Saccostrea echinata TaxID=191078 RepID=UPI002A80A11D|nr:uncharacterized protein LOC133191465 [Saccostrea echinata]
MSDIYIISLIWILVFEFADFVRGENICPRGNKTQCCAGYREIGGVCTVCVGFYGKNCAVPCPDDYFGEKCEFRCNCSLGEGCNPYVGCLSGETDRATGDKTESPQSVLSCVTPTIIVFVLCGSNLFFLALCIAMICHWRRSKNSKCLNSKTNDLYAGQIDSCSSDPQPGNRNTISNNYSHIRFKREELIINNSDNYSKAVLPYNTEQNVKTASTNNGFSEENVISEYPVGVMDTFRPSVKVSDQNPTPRPYSLTNYNRDPAEQSFPNTSGEYL